VQNISLVLPSKNGLIASNKILFNSSSVGNQTLDQNKILPRSYTVKASVSLSGPTQRGVLKRLKKNW